jgi:6-phosphofructokinase
VTSIRKKEKMPEEEYIEQLGSLLVIARCREMSELAENRRNEALEKAWIKYLAEGGANSMESRTNFAEEFKRNYSFSKNE